MENMYERVALSVCAAALVSLAGVSLAGAVSAAPRTQRYDEITVRRLRIVDASGATRLILTGKPMPEPTIASVDLRHIGGPRQDAGMMFYNDNGDEQGGLTYSGRNGEQGAALTFDAWHQDQALELQQVSSPAGAAAYIAGNELPKKSLATTNAEYMHAYSAARSDEERRTVRRRFRSAGTFGFQRWQLGNVGSTSELRLNDAHGHPRLRLTVSSEGRARIDFLDGSGAVVKSVTP